MLELNNIKCCSECWHSPEKPCPDFIKCLTGKPICHTKQDCENIQQEKLARLRYEIIDKPVIYIGTGTCGLGAGAGKTLAAIRSYLSANEINAQIVEVGCIGICAEEPLVDIQFPGKTRISFRKITADKINNLFDTLFSQFIERTKKENENENIDSSLRYAPFRMTSPDFSLLNNEIKEKALFQLRNAQFQPYENIPFMDEHPFFKYQTRLVLQNCGLVNPINIDEYIARGGYRALSETLKHYTPVDLCNITEQNGLRGRGGGGFTTGKKWKLAQAASADQKYLICNADEGDPGAFMDRAVIEGDPFRLLEGIAIAAYAIGATKAYIYIRAEYPLAIKHLKEAISQALAYGLLGGNILDSGFKLGITIKMGAGAFVCGEETALLNSIEGKRGMPRPRPPYPTDSGLFGKPTVINNVETLANLPEIFSNGNNKFSALGTAGSKGTKVFALSGNINRTGLVEVAMGTKLRRIIYDIGGGIPNGKKFKAVQIGGPSGGCIPEQHLDIEIDYESLKTVGAMMGSGGLVVMDEDTCMVDVAKYFMEFIQKESCGKCIPCREGTRRMLEILERITSGKRNVKNIAELERFQSVMNLKGLADVIKDTSLCGLGKSAPNPVLSTLRWFRDEYETHIYERKCPAKVCKDLITFKIIEEKCNGCGVCMKKCPSDAILGTLKHPHYIIEEKCIGCGTCAELCNSQAIIVE